MGVFGLHAPTYAEAGIPTFPVDTRAKRPSVKGWQRAGRKATCAWIESFSDADGLGVCMGARTRLTEIDVDMAGDAALIAALEWFGATPLTIRTASGKSKAWYRHEGERRQIRPFDGLPVDILGDGFTIVPPSYRPDLGASYHFLTGSLEDLERLPPIRSDAMDAQSRTRAAETVREGQRNHNLFLWAMAEARHCDDVEALIDAAASWNAAMPEPLSPREVERTARSAWGYEATGRNFVGLRRPQITEDDRVMDRLIDEPAAYALHAMLQRWHRNRPAFAIAPRAMSEGSAPPWPRRQIERARDVLLDRGYLLQISPPDASRRRSGRYRLTSPDLGTITIHPPPYRGWCEQSNLHEPDRG